MGTEQNGISETNPTLQRWHASLTQGKSPARLISFHSAHKLLIMAHSPAAYRRLGKLVAQAGSLPLEPLYRQYQRQLNDALRHPCTPGKQVNVLQHIFGYFKNQLSCAEKSAALQLFARYRAGEVPLSMPLKLMNDFVCKYQQSYLKQQVYLSLSPEEQERAGHG